MCAQICAGLFTELYNSAITFQWELEKESGSGSSLLSVEKRMPPNVRDGWNAEARCGETMLVSPPLPIVSLSELRLALQASWAPDTAYLGVHQPGNPALGQCYPTSRVVQWFFPAFEIATGQVRVGSTLEAHFWNIDPAQDGARHVDLTWQQFPAGAEIAHFRIIDRTALNDSAPTIARCELLLERVLTRMEFANAVQDRPSAAR